ncbi:MAG TPA: hypothetical protein VIS99_09370, partial [Terrimicrobiaceae bacterium]
NEVFKTNCRDEGGEISCRFGRAFGKSMNRLVLTIAFIGIVTSTPAELIEISGGTIEVEWASSPSPAGRALALDWVRTSARAVSEYYGHFPVRRVKLRIAERAGTRPGGGQAFGWRGPLITISLGRDATAATIANDWLLTHEMVHLGFPSLPERHHWLEEGLATYIEPIARVRIGILTPERAWADLVEGLPQGQPQAGDRGLDYTPTWGRTYWGGALFCLRADVAIRQRTANQHGLEDALRAVLAAGGSIDREWPIDRVIEVGDDAVGVPILRELYNEMSADPVVVDLKSLWQQLGIQQKGGRVSFDDTAPLAKIRDAIMPKK